MSDAWRLTGGRLAMAPVGWRDLEDLVRLKGDARVYALMLGGVRGRLAVMEELAAEVREWGGLGYGMWAVRALRGRFLGVTGLQVRADGRGVALRFAFWPEARGYGLASEAAALALRYGHEVAGLRRIVAVAAEGNLGSRQVLGAVGMGVADTFMRDGNVMLVYASVRGGNGP
jgi:RimJ/RimL family protein N-acetyltransferase